MTANTGRDALPTYITYLLALAAGAAVVLAPFGCRSAAQGQVPETAEPAAARPPEVVPPAAPEPLKVTQRVLVGEDVTVAKLDNGLTVIVRPIRTAPVVCVRGYVRAGGLYEGEWLGCGISHLLEHLVAENAAHDALPGEAPASPDRHVDRVREIGAQANAYTWLDHTCYYISAASDRTEACVNLLADWLARAEITQQAFEREHGVVQRELEMRGDDPGRQLWQAHMAALYGTHPAGVPVIGYKPPLAAVTYEDVLAYHRRMYVPQNMVISIAGDVDVPQALECVRREFAGFAPGRVPGLTLPEVRPLTGVRRVVRSHPELEQTRERMSFLTIPLVHDDLYPLDVLSFVLTQGESSRLVRTVLRDGQLVTSVESSSWTPHWGRGPFSVAFHAEPDKADAAEQAMLDELERIREAGVTDDELARAKRQKVADYVYSQQTVESISATLATDYLTTGDVGFMARYTDRIQAVTADEVRRVARTYLDPENMLVTRLVPKGTEADVTRAVAVGPPADEPEMFTLDNGLRVVLGPSRAVELVSMTFMSAGGVLAEDESTNGLGALMAVLATKGAGDRTAGDIAEFFDAAGGTLSGNCGNNTFYWQASVLDDRFDDALPVFADVVQRPTFAADELEIVRPQAVAAARQLEEDVFAQGQRFFRETFYDDSPYRLMPQGRVDVLDSATAERIAAWHRKHVVAGSSVLAVYGNFDADRARRRIRELFADLPGGKVELPSPPPRRPGGNRTFVKPTGKRVAAIFVGAGGMARTNVADCAAIDVLDTIISGYHLPSGWLHDDLRGRELVYVVHAYNWTGLAPGSFMAYAVCQPAKAGEVAESIRGHFRRAAGYEPTPQEVDEAVNIILTAELLGKQSMDALSMTAALDELYGLGYDYHSRLQQTYSRVTPADVRRVGEKYLTGTVTTITTPAPELVDSAAAGE
jgi:zinc protease